MKRKIILFLAIIALIQPLWAGYEYGAAKFDVFWMEDSKMWSCVLSPHNPPNNADAQFGSSGGISLEEYKFCSMAINGREGETKAILFCFVGLTSRYSNKDFANACKDLINNDEYLIKIKLSNGKKLEGIVKLSAMLERCDNGAEYDFKWGIIRFEAQLSDLHCKGEPAPDSLEHETFVAQLLTNSDIKEIEMGKFKQKIAPYFYTHKTIDAMLRSIADNTGELDIYFPTK